MSQQRKVSAYFQELDKILMQWADYNNVCFKLIQQIMQLDKESDEDLVVMQTTCIQLQKRFQDIIALHTKLLIYGQQLAIEAKALSQ